MRRRPDAAKKDLTAALALAPRDPAVLSAAAEITWERGEFLASSTHWLAFLEQKPDSVPGCLGFVRAEQERGQTGEAVAALRRGLKRLPNQPDLLVALTDLLVDIVLARSENDREGPELREAEELSSRLPKSGAKGRSLFLAGRIHQARKRWPKAMQAFVKAAKVGDLSPAQGCRLLLSLALCYARMDDAGRDLEAVRQAVQLDPKPSARLALRGGCSPIAPARRPKRCFSRWRSCRPLRRPSGRCWRER